jgi:3-hydroxybutyryl-CoA dehydratase
VTAMQQASLAAGGRIRSRGRTITEADLVNFSALTGDWHPQHADAEWAKHSRFGERIAHGMLVLSYSIGLVGFDPDEVVALRGIDGLTFKRPVRIGETIRVEAEVEEARPLDAEHELVTLRWRVLASEKLAVRAKVQVVRRLPQAGAAEANDSASEEAEAVDSEPEAGGAGPASDASAGGSVAAASARELYGREVLL